MAPNNCSSPAAASVQELDHAKEKETRKQYSARIFASLSSVLVFAVLTLMLAWQSATDYSPRYLAVANNHTFFKRRPLIGDDNTTAVTSSS